MYLIISNQTNNIVGRAGCIVTNENIKCIEVTQEIFDNFEHYMYDGKNIVLDPDYEEKQKQKEKDRINALSLSAYDVEKALYKSKGIDFEDLIEIAKQANEVQTVSLNNEQDKIDIKELKIELKANSFLRGDLYINKIRKLLGYTSEEFDYLFQNKQLPDKNSEVIEEKLEY